MISIGDKVLCINSDGHKSLINGKIYVVVGIQECSECKEPILDVGLKLAKKVWRHFCGKCKSFSDIEDPIVNYALASRFVKLDNLLDDCQWKKKTKKLSIKDIAEIAKKTYEEFIRKNKK